MGLRENSLNLRNCFLLYSVGFLKSLKQWVFKPFKTPRLTIFSTYSTYFFLYLVCFKLTNYVLFIVDKRLFKVAQTSLEIPNLTALLSLLLHQKSIHLCTIFKLLSDFSSYFTRLFLLSVCVFLHLLPRDHHRPAGPDLAIRVLLIPCFHSIDALLNLVLTLLFIFFLQLKRLMTNFQDLVSFLASFFNPVQGSFLFSF